MQLRGLPATIGATAKLALSSERVERPEVQQRLDALRRWKQARRMGLSSQQAAEVVGVPRSTLYRWDERLRNGGPAALANESRRPHKLRSSRLIDAQLLGLLRALYEQFPGYGKAKLHALLCHPQRLRRLPGPLPSLAERIEALPTVPSQSTIGRALAKLRARGQLQPLERRRYARRQGATRRRPHRPWAIRSSSAMRLAVERPGQLVQLDTLKVRGPGGERLVQFTATDVVSRFTVVQAYTAATARCAADFLGKLLGQMPFAVEALQVDGGSEFKADFEAACQQMQLPLHVLPPRSPKLNGRVERAHGNWRYEVYAAHCWPWPLRPLRAWLQQQQDIYNFVRPHQALGLLPPADYLQANFPDLAPHIPPSHMS